MIVRPQTIIPHQIIPEVPQTIMYLIMMLLTTPWFILGVSPAAPVMASLCSAPPSVMPVGLVSRTLQEDGKLRVYYVYIPSGYDPTQPVPLVISYHGFASSAERLAGYTGWNVIAEQYKFLVAYPQGNGAIAHWNSGLFENQGILADDVLFTRDMLRALSDEFCIDPNRIYANGASNGGGMAYLLACEMADVFAAVGTVAGAFSFPPEHCFPARPMPVIAFHGTADQIVPYNGGIGALPVTNAFPSVQNWAADWALRNDCDFVPRVLNMSDEVSVMRFSNCGQDADVILYTILGGGHTWPGTSIGIDLLTGYTTQDVNASAMMWAFFSEHQLQRRIEVTR